MIGVREQVVWIIYFLIFGYFLAVMNDILTYFLKKFRINQVLSYIIQLCFWLGIAYLATIYLMKVTNGALTVYTFAFFAFGALLYYFYFSKPFLNYLTRANNYLGKIYQKLKKIIIVIVLPKEVLFFIKKLIPKKSSFINLKEKLKKIFRRKKTNEKTTNYEHLNNEPNIS
ncbi:MAG: spore cortex biosynthesis protein YabQ [Bacilli bacterium]|nr:spore cortex biosynthesis protein YabQ [Bacilli bacterium]